jgi:hypothetical protein
MILVGSLEAVADFDGSSPNLNIPPAQLAQNGWAGHG